MVKIENRPKLNAMISVFGWDFMLNPIKIGKIGRIHGDNIEITPVKNEIKRKTSI